MTSFSTNKKAVRKFGIIALLFFGILCGVAILRQKEYLVYFFGFLSVVGLALFILPGPLKPIYVGWLRVSHFVGKINTLIILVFIYYLIISPVALLIRLFGGPLLFLKPDKAASSYWVVRSELMQSKERFKKRY